MDPQALAVFMEDRLRKLNSSPTNQDADKIVDAIVKLCASLNTYHESACKVTESAEELFLTAEDLRVQTNSERLETFLQVFDSLNRDLTDLIAEINKVRDDTGSWWSLQESITLKWFFFNILNPVIVSHRNWHLEVLTTTIQSLNDCLKGMLEIRDQFAENPQLMVNATLRKSNFFAGIGEGLRFNEAMARGWFKSFDEQRIAITHEAAA